MAQQFFFYLDKDKKDKKDGTSTTDVKAEKTDRKDSLVATTATPRPNSALNGKQETPEQEVRIKPCKSSKKSKIVINCIIQQNQ